MYADQQAKSTYRGEIDIGAVEAKRIAELPAQVDNLERGINFVEESLGELSVRLEGVVRPSVPEPAGTGQIQVAPPASGYASTIHSQSARVTRLGERIQDLLRRLEV